VTSCKKTYHKLRRTHTRKYTFGSRTEKKLALYIQGKHNIIITIQKDSTRIVQYIVVYSRTQGTAAGFSLSTDVTRIHQRAGDL